MTTPLAGALEPGWAATLAPVLPEVVAMDRFLTEEDRAGRPYAPDRDAVLRAFTQPFADVRVLILGQDPYPSRTLATGLSFSVPAELREMPSSVLNILREYSADWGAPMPSTGDLSPWASRGVLLLNVVLTVQEGIPASHQGMGWEAVTARALRALAARDEPLVAILLGSKARQVGGLIPRVPRITSAHPAGMSAASGFFGSRPFTRANDLLIRRGAPAIDWYLP
jgi:uracil-DNA glycosylase